MASTAAAASGFFGFFGIVGCLFFLMRGRRSVTMFASTALSKEGGERGRGKTQTERKQNQKNRTSFRSEACQQTAIREVKEVLCGVRDNRQHKPSTRVHHFSTVCHSSFPITVRGRQRTGEKMGREERPRTITSSSAQNRMRSRKESRELRGRGACFTRGQSRARREVGNFGKFTDAEHPSSLHHPLSKFTRILSL